jgi:hypothetical protein
MSQILPKRIRSLDQSGRSTMTSLSYRWPTVVHLGAIVGVVALTICCLSTYSQPERKDDLPPLDSTFQAKTDWKPIAERHLKRCEERVATAADGHLEPIIELLNRARNRVPQFSTTALGFGSKWRFAFDAVPFSRGDRSQTYLREEFETRVLDSRDLHRAIEESIVSFLQEVRSIEGQMLVEMRADLEDLPSVDWSQWGRREDWQPILEKGIEDVLAKSGEDFHGTVGSQLISLIAGEVLTQVAVRLGISAGILGTGAASGWATLGIGVVVGVVIDQLVSTAWNLWSDPENELTMQIQHQIDLLQRLICDGDETTKGLKQHFEKVAVDRAALRQIAIHDLMNTLFQQSK